MTGRAGGRPAVFLDRDGTIVEEVDHLHEPELVRLAPDAGSALASLAAAGFVLVVVTNQAGVARGLYGEPDVLAVHDRIGALLAGYGVQIDGWYYCPHHPDGSDLDYAAECDWRKPGPGMLLAAAERLALDLGRSWLVGNAWSDAEAALAAGVRPVLLATGQGAGLETRPGVPIHPTLAAAANEILAGFAARGTNDRPGPAG